MKKIIGISSLVLLSFVSLAFAGQPQGQPFQGIYDAISSLQSQINNIQLLPGPKGDKGDPGNPSWDEARVAALEARVATLENPAPPPTCTVIVCDNFNSYTDGSIVGQGGWVDRANGLNYQIQGAVTEEGTKALGNFNSTSDSVTTKIGNSFADGRQSAWVRTVNRANWTDYGTGGENAQVRISKGGWDSPSRIVVTFMKNGTVAYNDLVVPWTSFGTYDDNTWNLLDIEWRQVDKSARYRVNSGIWTSWVPFHSDSYTDFDTVGFGSIQIGSGGVYFDDLH